MAKRINYFLPYMRQGISTLADHSDITGPRMRMPVKMNIQAIKQADKSVIQDQLEKEVVLYGPGDILGINPKIIQRIAPPPNTSNFEASLSPFVEFREPDFLWRFSSRTSEDRKNWLPWLSLIILKGKEGKEDGEFSRLKNENKELPARIQLKPNAILPNLKESWRWAHVHLLEMENASFAQVINTIKNAPGKAVCRIMSPRRLQALTKYHAFLIPTYRIGMDAALGINGITNDRTILSWEDPVEASGKAIAYYYEWEFRTGTEGDFEYLVRQLKPRDLENLGTRAIDCSNPGYGLQQEELKLQMEAALKSLDTEYQEWAMDAKGSPNEVQQKLGDLLNKRIEEINGELKLRVTPPVYGEWYASKEGETIKINAAKNKKHWLEELNLDFRHRAAAGLGVRFVKENQEDLMKAAWEQLSKIKKVNKELNLGRFGRAVSQMMYKRMSGLAPDTMFKLSLPLKNKMVEASSSGRRSLVSGGITMGASLSRGSISNKLTNVKVKKYLSNRRQASSKIYSPVSNYRLVEPGFRVDGMARIKPRFITMFSTVERETNTFNQKGEFARQEVHPDRTIDNKWEKRIRSYRKWEKREEPSEGGNSFSSNSPRGPEDKLRPVMWHPEFHRSMYRFLRELSQEYILPGLENIPQNTVGLLQTNRRFIEAYMLGLNHEFASELRWREFPTDMRGSYFRSFWDTSIYSLDQSERVSFRTTSMGLNFLSKVQKKYGKQYAEENNGLAITIPKMEAMYTKGEPTALEKILADEYEAAVEKWLLSREEDKDIDKPENWDKKSRLGDHPIPGKLNNAEEDQNSIVVLVRGELLLKFGNTLIYLVPKSPNNLSQPDLSNKAKRVFPIFEGALPPDMVFMGFPITKESVKDYFVIFEERMTDLRFGLDIQASEGAGENDLSWEHFKSVEEDQYLDENQPTILKKLWKDPANIAKIMVQKQVRVAIELGQLIPDA